MPSATAGQGVALIDRVHLKTPAQSWQIMATTAGLVKSTTFAASANFLGTTLLLRKHATCNAELSCARQSSIGCTCAGCASALQSPMAPLATCVALFMVTLAVARAMSLALAVVVVPANVLTRACKPHCVVERILALGLFSEQDLHDSQKTSCLPSISTCRVACGATCLTTLERDVATSICCCECM